jgi:SAM-dependent methyltransferase
VTDARVNEPNFAQSTYWNEVGGPRWVSLQEEMDVELERFGVAVRDALSLAPGARVLDVGCGAGATTLVLAERVRPGSAVGVDISAPLLARARERAAGVSGVDFVLGDAQVFPFEAESFDAVASRFGVMFFADAVAAFSNLYRALRPGGELAFVCWRGVGENPSFSLPLEAARPFLTEVPEAGNAGDPGPFAFAEPGYVERVLALAGFRDVSVAPFDTPLAYGAGRDLEGAVDRAFELGPLARLRAPLAPDVLAGARSAIREALRPHEGPNGVVLPAATWLVTARR